LADIAAPSERMSMTKMTTRNLSRRLLATSAVAIVVAIATASHTLPASEVSVAGDLIPRLMPKENVSGAAVALIKDGRIVLAEGYGVRDTETQAPVTTATLFNIGSISKSFTALGVAQLVDQRKADLDVPVINYLPDLKLIEPGLAQTLTLRRLLSHSSGFPADEKWPQQVPSTRRGIVAEFSMMPTTAPPGVRFQYCSRCIVLAAYVLERITGQSWEAYTRSHIFEVSVLACGGNSTVSARRAECSITWSSARA
jgi:CubicO group peptidase (beta-lactamase class C family)